MECPMADSPYHYNFTRITFNDGTSISPGPLTVFVGPNNSGKSRALRDVASLTTGNDAPQTVVVRDVEAHYPTSLRELRESYDVDPCQEPGGLVFRCLNPELHDEYRSGAGGWPDAFEAQFGRPKKDLAPWFRAQFGRALIAFLTTEARLRLVIECESADHHSQEARLLQALYNADRSIEKAIREKTKDAFGMDLALDFHVLRRLCIRVGNDLSDLPADPRDAREPLEASERLDQQGDGIRSFVGIITALAVLNRGVFLIDEPEAFLYPAQAFRVGQVVAEEASQRRQVIVATHSAEFLRGLLSKTSDAAIVRIDRAGNTNSFRILDATRLKQITYDPLLSSSRVLEGLFYAGAVVTEGDRDARFYMATSSRVKRKLDLHFLNADNKQTVSRILALYHTMGVRAAGIVDFDFLNDKVEAEKALKQIGCSDKELASVKEFQTRLESSSTLLRVNSAF